MKERKKNAARKAVEWIEDGMTIGLGTGSTTFYALEAIGEMVRGGYELVGVPTSIQTEEIAEEFGIPLTTLEEVERLDVTIDGADEVDPSKMLLKGMGGALLREKIVASCTDLQIIVVDDSKLVDDLGTRSPLPVEVVPFGYLRTKEKIESTGCKAKLRGGKSPKITDSGNFVYDCKYGIIKDPEKLERDLNAIPGVVENGLFIGMADRIIVAGKDGVLVRD